MNGFEVIKFDKSYLEDWNSFVYQSKDGMFLFDRNFMEYHAAKFNDHSLIVKKEGVIVALFPCNTVDTIVYSHGGLTFGSLLYSSNLLSTDVLHVFELILSYFKDSGFKKIIYKAIPYIFAKYPAQEDLYALYRFNARLVRRDISSVVYIPKALDFVGFKKRHIKKNQKNEALTFNEPKDFSKFWDLLSDVLLKYDAHPVHSLDEIHLLKDRFKNNIRLFTLNKEEHLLAGVVVFDFGNVVHTQYLASSEEGRGMDALAFINYRLINEEFRDRNFFSFGISTEDSGRFLNEGLIHQKEYMGARAVTLDFYEIDI